MRRFKIADLRLIFENDYVTEPQVAAHVKVATSNYSRH